MLENQAMIDKLLGGRYRIITTLGSGGFSQTYVAEDTHRPGNPKCAVKHLHPANNNQSILQSARRLFNSEAETLEKLGNHDRIPRLLAYFEENQEFYLVQEFIEGQLLADKLRPNQHWTENQVWEFIKEILEILVFIHAQGFIHRDVKPSNIIQRQQDNKLVLVDFGAVKQNWTQLLNQTSNIEVPATVGIGTPGYMPMEQARGRPRPSSDIYALGAIALQALTGLHPIKLEEDFETGELLWQEQAQVSGPMAAIISKMVRYHFKDRYETASDALAEVQQLAPLYLPTEISLNLPATLDLTGATQIDETQQTLQTTQNFDTGVTTPAFPRAKENKNSATIGVNNSALPGTTIFSPLKPKSLFTNRRSYYLSIGATISAALISLGAGYAIYWQPRWQFEQSLEQLEDLKVTGKYDECIARASTIPQKSSLYADAQKAVQECKLIESKRLATDRDFQGAIALASALPKGTTTYEQAQPLIAQWSNSILALATGKYQAGKLKEAIALAQGIPTNSLVYQKAQTTIKQWQAPIAKNNSYMAATAKTTTAAARKVVHTTTARKTTRNYSIPTKKVVKRVPSTYKPRITAAKPKSYTRKASASTRRVTPSKRAATSTVRRAATPTKRTSTVRRVSTSSRMATSTSSKRSTSSSKKYLRISKKVATNSQFRTRTKKVLRRVTNKVKSNRSSKSYRWTTKTVN